MDDKQHSFWNHMDANPAHHPFRDHRNIASWIHILKGSTNHSCSGNLWHCLLCAICLCCGEFLTTFGTGYPYDSFVAGDEVFVVHSLRVLYAANQTYST